MTPLSKLFPILFVLINLFACLVAKRGPHPSDIAPSTYASEELKQLTIPAIGSKCTRRTPPVLRIASIGPSYSYRDWEMATKLLATFNWCKKSGDELRFRVLRFRSNGTHTQTDVLSAEVQTLKHRVSFSHVFKYPRECTRPLRVYGEACVRVPGLDRPLCGTTKIKVARPFLAQEPRLKFRPPIHLHLSPGDSARVITRIVNASGSGMAAFGNGGYDRWPKRFLLKPVVRSRKGNGRRLKATMLQERNRSVLYISKADTKKRTRLFNNSAVFIEFAEHSCPQGISSYYGRYDTRIVISESFKSLIRQDSKLPEFDTPEFPIIDSLTGIDVKVTVNATNRGGGLRADGRPTELHYQWYRRYGLHNPFTTYAEAIERATGPTLTVQRLSCEAPSEELSTGTYWYKYYYVDVCNTFGCRRSEVMRPRYTSKAGDVIYDDVCEPYFLWKESQDGGQ